MSELITIREMLAYMESGQAFAISGVTYDRKRKQGGAVYEYPEAVLAHELELQNNAAPAPPVDRALTPKEAGKTKPPARDPNHRHWYTRNIRLLQQGQPTTLLRKIHPPLVLRFNGKIVVP